MQLEQTARLAAKSPTRLLRTIRLVLAGVIILPRLCWGGPPTEFSEQDLEFFEREIRPLLAEHCFECHSNSAEDLEGGLRLDSRAAILAGGDTRPAIVPGDPAKSLLIDAISYGDLYQMPPKAKLPAEAIDLLSEWVRRGAPWPAEKTNGAPTVEQFDLEERKGAHWAWQPIVDRPAPQVNDVSWPLDPLDKFVLAKLEAADVAPAPTATPSALLRRIYFDLIGLPPPPEVRTEFLADSSPEAIAAIVDRLLASPQFGERWARHWLDVMRYAESRGHEYDIDLPNAWQYRDYVIRALNADLPYDQLVREHIAGDLLEHPRRNPASGFNESILATAFWYLGDWVHSPVDIRKDETDRFDNAIDVLGKAFLGLTVACARCHDHKFDAISQRDYYALAGFMQSSGYQQTRFETAEHNQEVAAALDQLRRQAGREYAARAADEVANPVKRLRLLLPAAVDALAHGVRPGTAGESATSGPSFFLAGRTAAESASHAQQRIREAAARYGVSAEDVAPWIREIAAAGQDSQHPLTWLFAAAVDGLPDAVKRLQASASHSWQLPDSTQVVINYDDPQSVWLVDGPAYGDGPLRRGEVVPAGDGSGHVGEIVTRGHAALRGELADLKLRNGTMTDPGNVSEWPVRPGRVLRTPGIELQGGKLFYLMRGAAHVQVVIDSHRMIQGPLHTKSLKVIGPNNKLRWEEHDLTPYVGHGIHVEFSPHPDQPLEVWMVVEGTKRPSLPDDAARMLAARTFGAAATALEAADRVAEVFQHSISALAGGTLADDRLACALANWVVSRRDLFPPVGGAADQASNAEDAKAQQIGRRYSQRRDKLLANLQRESATAPSIWDGTPQNERLLIRGNPRVPGEEVPRRFLAVLGGDPNGPMESPGSGRLELAAQLLRPTNPFPARVMVNRIWHHLTGRGIVPSVDNFGVLGEEPTHPELLDHLAVRFVDSGWSIKSMIRAIMLSQTYQMASRLDPAAEQSDPDNRLWHRMPVRRLEAEAIRDSMLALSGRLDGKMFGASVPVHLTEFMQGRGRPTSGPLDGDGRRSIYIAVRRNFLAPMMLAFDTPQPAGPVGRRIVSNVPAQALILMNDPFVADQARLFAKRLLAVESDDAARVNRLYVESLGREPSAAEQKDAAEFLKQCQALAADAADDNELRADAWTDLCHVVFNLKEFIYLH